LVILNWSNFSVLSCKSCKLLIECDWMKMVAKKNGFGILQSLQNSINYTVGCHERVRCCCDYAENFWSFFRYLFNIYYQMIRGNKNIIYFQIPQVLCYYNSVCSMLLPTNDASQLVPHMNISPAIGYNKKKIKLWTTIIMHKMETNMESGSCVCRRRSSSIYK
jgi:hypothetical protein